MQNTEHIEVAIRAEQIAKSVLELLEGENITCARLRLAATARQLNELNALLAKIEARANVAVSGPAVAGTLHRPCSAGDRP